MLALRAKTDRGLFFGHAPVFPGFLFFRYVNKRIIYTDEPMDGVKPIPDFLPSPHALVLREDNVKVTLQSSRSSLEFFKGEATAHNTHYQRVIRRRLDDYATRRLRRVTPPS
nr:MAG: hypothetical protein BECKTUN1418D_GA0071000_10176 [Candidatus Kentron sp. TUN]